MILPPFDPAAVLMLAAILPIAPQEPAVAELTSFAQRLAGFGFYGPFRVRPVGAVIEDRAGHPFIHALPVIGPADYREVATIACLALNRLCGFASAEDKLDPDHIDGVCAESARFLTQTGRPADAAE